MTDVIMITLTVLTFVSLWHRSQRVWQFSYAVLFVTGLSTSSLSVIALIPLVLLIVSLNLYKKGEKGSLLAGIVALVLGLALGMHVLPGFHNIEFASDVTLSANAASFDIWFNFDKSMFGLLVLGIVLHGTLIRSATDTFLTIKTFLPLALAGIMVIYGIGLLLGYSAIDWTPAMVFFPWAIKNIVFTVLAEEAFFRGILQNVLSKRLNGHIAVVIAGVLFGAAHFGGGMQYVLLSSLAGILYGYAYKLTGRIEAAIATHFLLNAGHFLFFSYPYSAI